MSQDRAQGADKAAMALRLIDCSEPERRAAVGAGALARAPAAAASPRAKDWPGSRAVVAQAGAIEDAPEGVVRRLTRTQVPLRAAESSDDTPGHGRPARAFPGGTERPMSLDVPPPARPLAVSSVARASGAGGRADTLAEVWDQVDAAARLAEELHSQGRGVRFDVDERDGSVVARLVDDDGGTLRQLPLGDVIDVDRLAYELGNEQP
jgi:hypothetical protein